MEELIIKLWPYFEKAGVVAGTIMTIMFIMTYRELKGVRTRAEAYNEQLVKDSKAAVAVIEKNTAAITQQSAVTAEQNSLIRAMIMARMSRLDDDGDKG